MRRSAFTLWGAAVGVGDHAIDLAPEPWVAGLEGQPLHLLVQGFLDRGEVHVCGDVALARIGQHVLARDMPPELADRLVQLSAVQVFAWVATLWQGRPVMTTSLLFALGFLFTFSITAGMGAGFIAYVVIKVALGKARALELRAHPTG